MSTSPPDTPPATSETPEDRFSAAHWDARYAGTAIWSGAPNTSLTTEVSALRPGRALDVGCGEGADAVWLAAQGWEVTALDISRRAVERAENAAEAAGVTLHTLVAPFLEADLPPEGFDLVSAMYPVIPREQSAAALHRLAGLVAPGGTLLFVHHDLAADDEHHHHVLREIVTDPAEVRAVLDESWVIDTEERRERHVPTGQGAGHRWDLVLRTRRR
ncbi:methyltransferase domain-containing protein [Brachybacterium sp. EF45031]|uniref:class I SAM-dependent methyltransferase n=1 Tax=Brachybacterium sillae TaxID=2810536 RepID=UPI00217CCF83|nr:class I SAM-dependent methyltransferase [Brachybacterium sillae]MCS6712634.1 methyltransferase domain-containing protein [Brachybacterium sillae]